MQFTLVTLFLLASTALALPASHPRSILGDIGNGISSAASDVGNEVKSAASDVASGAKTAVSDVKNVVGANCDIVKCATALGPEAVGCGAAAAQAFADPVSDLACLATALNNAANTPAACNGCSL